MKLFIVIIALVALAGCSTPLIPVEGTSFNEFNTMSIKTMNGSLVLVNRDANFDIYQTNGAISLKQLISQGNIFAKASYDPKKDAYYIFKNGKLYKVAYGEYELNKVLNNNEEMRALGFTNEVDYQLGKMISANAEQVNQLKKYGINNYFDFQKAKVDFDKNKSLYGNQETPAAILQFVLDKNTAKTQNKPLSQVVQARKTEEARIMRQRQEDEAKRKAERAKEYPYEATLSCGFSGNTVDIMACFVGGGYAAKTQLEIRNGQQYGMYQGWELEGLGRQTSEGLVIPLRNNFSIVAQNSSDTLILSVEIRNSLTRQVIFKKSAAQYGVVSVRN